MQKSLHLRLPKHLKNMNTSETIILGIESSCDETGIALFSDQRGALAHQLFSQIDLHRAYGGVVPELASRDHIKRLLPLYRQCMQDASLQPQEISAIAYTAGPGLIGALLTGASFALALAYGLDLPVISIHHLEGHLLAALMAEEKPRFPFIALLVSGGHTQLLRVDAIGHYHLLGTTLDDAAGEAFDKTAKLMGLPYPGGPELAHLAETGDAQRYDLPRPMLKHDNLDFSFSGLKTKIRLLLEQEGDDPQKRADLAASFQAAVNETLTVKSQRALDQEHCRDLIVAGGVGANRDLRQRLRQSCAQRGARVLFPPYELCTDNGLMIAFAGLQHMDRARRCLDIDVHPRWNLAEANA